MTLYEYLRRVCEDVPAWLRQFRQGDAFPRRSFLHPASSTIRARGSTDTL